MVPFEMGRILAANIPGARFLPLDGENHILQPSDSGWRRLFLGSPLTEESHLAEAAH